MVLNVGKLLNQIILATYNSFHFLRISFKSNLFSPDHIFLPHYLRPFNNCAMYFMCGSWLFKSTILIVYTVTLAGNDA